MENTTKRIAILSDMHGNDLALEAVLKDITARGGVDTYWVLGDLAAIGPAPVKVLEILAALSDAHFIRGNTDRYLSTGERPRLDLDNPAGVKQVVDIVGAMSWAQGALTVTGWLDWLAALPLEYRTQLPDGTRVLCVHAAHGTDDGHGITTRQSAEEIEALLAGCEADLVCVGHTHQPYHIHTASYQVVNPGSISNPGQPDLRASYAILKASQGEFVVEHHRVEYDYTAFLDTVQRMNHPALGIIQRHFGMAG